MTSPSGRTLLFSVLPTVADTVKLTRELTLSGTVYSFIESFIESAVTHYTPSQQIALHAEPFGESTGKIQSSLFG
jgi:hypothetical protein